MGDSQMGRVQIVDCRASWTVVLARDIPETRKGLANGEVIDENGVGSTTSAFPEDLGPGSASLPETAKGDSPPARTRHTARAEHCRALTLQ